MLDWVLVLLHSLVYSLVASAIVISIMRIDNRIFFLKAGLPDEVTADVTPFTDAEKRRNQLLNLIRESFHA